ncbi:MAG: hypothetical protein RI897_3900 [Verrucomicrobiota bacterium]
MQQTCSRRGVSPNPPSEAATASLWKAVCKCSRPRLTLAVFDGNPIAARLNIGFGRRFSLFKTGWNGAQPKSHPNELLDGESLAWAAKHGYELADWVGISKDLAQAAKTDPDWKENHRISPRDGYVLHFGGSPVLLPPALLYIPNPVLRFAYKLASPLLRRTRISKASQAS